jgi:thiol-disulfide isomerase/thioredoxin
MTFSASATVLQLGPLVLPTTLLLQALGIAAALLVGRRLGRRAAVAGQSADQSADIADIDARLLRLFWVGLVVARLSFVWSWRQAYLAHPLSMLDLRDGGFDPVAGYAAASLLGLAQISHQPALRRPCAVALVLALSGWVGAEALRIAWPAPASRSHLPELTLTSAADGRTVVALATAFQGRPVVLNLWATWCPPCRQEMPLLLQQAQAQAEQGEDAVHFVFVDQGESRDEVLRFLQQEQAGPAALRNVLLDPARQLGAAFDARALPTTLFFNARGELVSTRIGVLSEATLAQRLALVTSPAPASSAPSSIPAVITPASSPP